MQRVVVDTNVWVSALLNPVGYPARILAALQARQFILLVSQPMLDELRDVLSRPRLTRKYGITEADAAELITLLRARAEEVTVSGTVQVCRDPDDDAVLETAICSFLTLLVRPRLELMSVYLSLRQSHPLCGYGAVIMLVPCRPVWNG